MWSRTISLWFTVTVWTTVAGVNVQDGAEGGLTLELMQKFQKWTAFHGRQYDSHEEKMKRLQIWIDNDGT